jgi:hypothetical protein
VIGLIVVRGFHFPRAAILPHIPGFGKNVIALFGLWMRQDLLLIGSGLVHGLRENRRLIGCHRFGFGIFHKFILRPIVKTMDAGAIAFRDQFRLGRQPVLHLVTGQRTSIFIGEVSLPGHFVR